MDFFEQLKTKKMLSKLKEDMALLEYTCSEPYLKMGGTALLRLSSDKKAIDLACCWASTKGIARLLPELLDIDLSALLNDVEGHEHAFQVVCQGHRNVVL